MVGLEDVTNRDDFVRQLDLLRQRAGLTVRELAKAVGTPHGTIGGYISGRHLPGAGQTELFVRILAACGLTEPAEVERWVDALVRVRRPVGRRPTRRTAPYRGLECFHPEHGDWFFGRETLTRELVDRVARGSGLLAVVGPSGSGKSSLLRAGLAAALERRAQRCLVFTPGAAPVRTLARKLAELTGLDEDTLDHDLRVSPADLAAADGLVLVADQLEEIFTLCSDTTERQAFVAALAAVPARVVVGLRADFYVPALRHTELAQALQHSQVVVGPMSESELRRAIAEPAHKAQLKLEEGLVELLLRDLGLVAARDPGALPLLSHALLSTWERGSRGRMTVEDYTATGGISGAVAQTAEAVHTELTPAQQDIARRLFLRLVHVGEDRTDTRRRVHRTELANPLDESELVLDRFVDRRLLTVDADTVNISHEVLIVAWPRLREWIDADRIGLRIHRQLTDVAQAWQEGGRDDDALHRGSRLAAATEWSADPDHHAAMNQLEREFLQASVRRDLAEQAQARRRTRRLYQLLAALVALTLLAGALAVVAQRQTSRANEERDLAVSRQVAITANRLRDYDPGLAAQLALSAYRIAPTFEARSSLIASSGSPTVTRMVRPGGTRQVIAVSPNGRLLAGAGATEESDDTAVLLWDLSEPQAPRRLDMRLTGHTEAVHVITFSPDGRTLATGGADGTIRLWNVAEPADAVPLGRPLTDEVLGLAFSPDGRVLAAGGADGTVRLWDVADPDAPVPLAQALTGAAGSVQGVAFRPDGQMLAAADAAGAVLLWDVSDPRRARAVGAPLPVPYQVNAVAFTPDGTTLAAGSHEGMVRFYAVSEVSTPVPVGEPLAAADGQIHGLTFNGPGDVLAVASADSTARLWDWTNQRMIVSLPHQEPLTSVAFQADRFLVTNSVDGIARLWTVPGPAIPGKGRTISGMDFARGGNLLATAGTDVQLATLTDRNHLNQLGPAHLPPIPANVIGGTVAISPDGRVMATDLRPDYAVLLWDVSDPNQPVPLGPPLAEPAESVEDLEFSPDGTLLAAGSDDGTVRLWDVSDPARPISLAPLYPADRSDLVLLVRFSPDGRTLAATTSVGTVAFWDLADPRRPKPLGPPLAAATDLVYAAAYSSDSRVLAVGGSDGKVTLWDVVDRARPRRIATATGLDGHVHALTFSADGRYLAGGTIGRVRIWQVVDRGLDPFATLDRGREPTWSVEFGPAGHTLAAASGDLKLWNVDPESVATRTCSTAGDPLTEAEWRKHVPDTTYRPTCATG